MQTSPERSKYREINSLMKKFIEKAGGILASVPLMASPFLSLAQEVDIKEDITQIYDILCDVFFWLFMFFILIAVLFIILAGVKYLTAGGDPEKVSKANHQLIYAVVAIVVAILARSVPGIINTFLRGRGDIVEC